MPENHYPKLCCLQSFVFASAFAISHNSQEVADFQQEMAKANAPAL